MQQLQPHLVTWYRRLGKHIEKKRTEKSIGLSCFPGFCLLLCNVYKNLKLNSENLASETFIPQGWWKVAKDDPSSSTNTHFGIIVLPRKLGSLLRFLSIKEMKNLLRRKFEGNFIRVRKNRHWAVEGDWRLRWKTLCSELCSATEGQQAAPWQSIISWMSRMKGTLVVEGRTERKMGRGIDQSVGWNLPRLWSASEWKR